MKHNLLVALGFTSAVAFGASTQSVEAAEAVSVLHYWTSGGEAKAIGVLKDDLNRQGFTWNDYAVAGGNGAAAMTALRTQVIAGNAPTAAQLTGPLVQDWAEQNVLVSIDSVAADWSKNLPPEIDQSLKVKGHYMAVPFSVHRSNWLYINKVALDKVGATTPTTWPEFFAVADKMQAAGIIPVAAGGQPWQDLTIWEDVVLSEGADFYKKAVVDLDPATLTSEKMIGVFETVRKIQGYFDKGRVGRDWNLATAMVIDGKAGMQFMGDWAKGEFAAANKKSGMDYICAAAPGTDKGYTFDVDLFAFFQQKGQTGATPGQLALAKTIMTPEFQEQFSLNKGSIPIRVGVDLTKFDDCAKKSYADELVAIKAGGYVPSLANAMVQSDAVAGAITDVVANFMSSKQDAKSAVQALAKAAKTN